MEGLVGVHNVVGTLVVLAYLIVVILNVLAVAGREVAFRRPLSFAAAALLLVQYVIGFVLLGGGLAIQPIHYVIALLAIVTVGLEHGYAPSRETPSARQTASLIASLLTLIIVVAAYVIGTTSTAG